MHWSPLPRRGTTGIEAWQPQWMCMRCHNELQLEHICVPDPTPACPLCLTLMLWEVDLTRRQERWVCSRCPYARSARPLALGAAPPCDLPDLPSPAPQRAAPAPALAPTQYTTLGPPPLPLRDGTNSALYVPLLLDAAGMLAAQAQRDWRSRAPINEWWPAAVDALRARAFIPVKELSAAVEHVALAFAPPVLHSSSVLRFRAWAAERPGHVTSLAELVRAIAVAPEGHYIAAPLQEALLTLLVGPAAVTTLARLIEGHRARPVDVPSLPPPPPPGMPRSPHALRPKMSKPSRALASEAGSGTPPVPATGTRSRCISPPCPLRLARCCCPKLGRTPPVASRCAPRTKQSLIPPRSFGCSCFAACACRCHSPRESVHAAGRLTRSATIEQHVPTPVPWLPAPFLSSELSPGSARRLGHESPALPT